MAVNTRLHIREIPLDLPKKKVMFDPIPQHNTSTFSASFLNPTVIQNKSQNTVALNQLFPGIEEFDIRNECTN